MKIIYPLIALFVFILLTFFNAYLVHAQSEPIFIKTSDIEWVKGTTPDGSATFYSSVLHIDPNTQATELVIKYGANTNIPWHFHSANETHTVISGKSFFEADGKVVEMGPGGFNYIPAKMVHRAWTTDQPVMYFITVDGAWDIIWVDKSKANK